MQILHSALLFGLELASLAAIGLWSRVHVAGWLWIAVPVVVVGAWSTFTVPADPGSGDLDRGDRDHGDRGRSDKGSVSVPGWLRLLLELAVFAFAVLALWQLNRHALAAGLGALILLHHGLSHQRLRWLLTGSDRT